MNVAQEHEVPPRGARRLRSCHVFHLNGKAKRVLREPASRKLKCGGDQYTDNTKVDTST